MYNWEPTLPIDVNYNLVDIEGNGISTAISMRANIHQTAGENICSAQEKQRRDIIDAITCLLFCV